MDSSSGASTESFNRFIYSGSGQDLQALMNQKKRKRMLSNRDSARRSRMRKQMRVDDLMAQLKQLRIENSQFRTVLSISSQQYQAMEADNSVLKTQAMELTARLDSLTEILECMNLSNSDLHPWWMLDKSFAGESVMAPPSMLQYYEV